MYLLTAGKWQPGFCDYERYLDDHLKIKVCDWYLLGKVDKQYISYPMDWRILWNYLLDVGFRAVCLKLISRLREKNRNDKYYAVGTGVVEESFADSRYKAGDHVVFFAPNHPECASCVVVSESMVCGSASPVAAEPGVRFFKTNNFTDLEPFNKYAGWSFFSGEVVDRQLIEATLLSVDGQISATRGVAKPRTLAVTAERRGHDKNIPNTASLKASLFGLGNYAKVFIIPNLDKRISLCAVHEIDPSQIGLKSWGDGYVSTSPFPSVSQNFDIYFAAGYHHTHAAVAVHALKQGACAVIEKPLATTEEQLVEITDLLNHGSGRLFVCFHKRYSQLNEWIQEDFRAEPGNAIDYHCIVYEIALPQRHWYNWRTSGSRIVSNGCHWIDHFMFLNAYSPAVKYSVTKAGRGQILIYIELENGAVFSMCLTDVGSPRVGVRDYIELRKGQTTIYMTDSSQYASENARGWIRKKSVNKIDAYRRMYEVISTMIADGKPGDSLESLRSSHLVTKLDKLLASGRPLNETDSAKS